MNFVRKNCFVINIIFHDLFIIIFCFRVLFFHDSQIVINMILFWHFCVSFFVQIICFDFEIKFQWIDYFFVLCRHLVILLQTVLICCEQFEFFNRILIFICSLFKWTLNNKTIIFILNIWIEIILKTFVIIRKHLFCIMKKCHWIFIQFVNEFMSNCWCINHNQMNHHQINLFCFNKKCFSHENHYFKQCHALCDYFDFNYFHMKMLF